MIIYDTYKHKYSTKSVRLPPKRFVQTVKQTVTNQMNEQYRRTRI